MDDDEDDDDMHDDGDDSFGDDGDDEMLDEGTELTTQLAAAGWQHGVVFCFVNTLSQVSQGGSEVLSANMSTTYGQKHIPVG